MYGIYLMQREDDGRWVNLEQLAHASTLAEAQGMAAEDYDDLDVTICYLPEAPAEQ